MPNEGFLNRQAYAIKFDRFSYPLFVVVPVYVLSMLALLLIDLPYHTRTGGEK
mgnify:CR=1 FL=1